MHTQASTIPSLPSIKPLATSSESDGDVTSSLELLLERLRAGDLRRNRYTVTDTQIQIQIQIHRYRYRDTATKIPTSFVKFTRTRNVFWPGLTHTLFLQVSRTCTHAHEIARMHTHTYTHTHQNPQTHIHTHTHTHPHTPTPTLSLSLQMGQNNFK
jgi:hypothetical protein